MSEIMKEQTLQESSLEDLMQNIQLIMQKLENKNTSLEEAFLLYQDGMDMLKVCNEKIDLVEKKMIVLQGEE